VVLAATLHAYQCLAREDLDRAADVLARTVDWGLAHPSLDLLTGALLECLALGSPSPGEQAEALAGSRAAYQRCLQQAERRYEARPLPGATSWAGETRLATVDLLCGRPDEALEGFDRALATHPTLLEARLGRLEALLDLGLAAEALQGLEPWLAGGTPDAWTLAAAAAAALGALDDAGLFADRAREASSTHPWTAPHRRLRLEALEALPA
jgi:tetratricopeptide (TPR) repeat protein